MSRYTYRRLPVKLIRVGDEIMAADGRSWIGPVTHVDHLSRPWWTSLWWSTKPSATRQSPADLTRPNDYEYQVRRPRPNHNVTLDEVAAEFGRHGVTSNRESATQLRVSTKSRNRSALIHFYADTGTFAGAHIGSEWVRSLDVVRRRLGVPTNH